MSGDNCESATDFLVWILQNPTWTRPLGHFPRTEKDEDEENGPKPPERTTEEESVRLAENPTHGRKLHERVLLCTGVTSLALRSAKLPLDQNYM